MGILPMTYWIVLRMGKMLLHGPVEPICQFAKNPDPAMEEL